MYLSYLLLDKNNLALRRGLANAYEMHRTILAAFEQVSDSGCARKELGVLYRLIEDGELKLYVMHQATAHWGKIASQGVRLAPLPNNPKPIDGMVENFRQDAVYTFDLLHAPTKKVKRADKLSHRQVIKTTAGRIEWLQRKGAQHGFVIDPTSVYESGQQKIFFSKQGCAQAAQTAVRFRGHLTVTDATLFQNAFVAGIGSGKSFGLGMLLLFPQGNLHG